MLTVTAEEHRMNFRVLYNHKAALDVASQTNDDIQDSVGLLLSFYSVEVGLKFLLNHAEKIPFRHQVANRKTDEFVEKFSHDLPSIISRLKIPASRLSAPPSGPFNCGTQSFDLSQSHEAWRYGLSVLQADQTTLKSYMEELTTFLLQEVPE